MKNLILIGLLFSGSMAYSNDLVELICNHSSEDNWALGGESKILRLEVDKQGVIIAGEYGNESGEGHRSQDGTTSLVIPPKKQVTASSHGISVDIYKNFYISFISEELVSLKKNEVITGEVQNNDYLAYFNEEIQCERL